MADLRCVSLTMAAVIFYTILQISIAPVRQSRVVFPRSENSADEKSTSLDHGDQRIDFEGKVSNLRNTQTMTGKMFQSIHAHKRNSENGDNHSISKENDHLSLSDDFTPGSLAPDHKNRSSAVGKETDSLRGNKFGKSEQSSRHTLSPGHLAEGSNVANEDLSADNISKDRRRNKLVHLESTSKMIGSADVDEKVPSSKVNADVNVEMDDDTDVGGDADVHNAINEISALFQDQIYWSDDAESVLPARIPETSATEWRADVVSRRVVGLLPGCGRDKNRLAILDNGEKLCCRYRQNFDQIQGEILSYHFSQLLGFDNLPFSTLLKVEMKSEQWAAVGVNVTKAGWKDGKIIVATKWIADLEPAYMPFEYRSKNATFPPERIEIITSALNHNPAYLIELIQWSDLILFDYLTANLDRIVNTLVNLQWNKFMFEQPVHNLEVSKSDRRLVFLDNESGLLHGYRMLSQYGHYHEQILKSVRVFRAQTRRRLDALDKGGNVWDLLKSKLDLLEPLFEELPSFPPRYRDVLQKRIAAVVDHMNQCQTNN